MKIVFTSDGTGVYIDGERYSFKYIKAFHEDEEFNLQLIKQDLTLGKSVERQHNKVKYFLEKFPEYLI